MGKNNAKTDEMTALRRKAEKRLNNKIVRLRKQTSGDLERVVHELQIHQIELEMQNEELRRTQHQLEESRQKYANLYDFAPIGYFTLDKNGIVTEANLTGCKMLGVERKNLINKPFHSYVAEDSQNAFYLHRRAALNPGPGHKCGVRLVRGDGEEFEARLDSIPVLNDGEHVIGSRVAVIDITGRKHAEAALCESEERYRTFFEGSLDAVLLTCPDGSIDAANAAACQMFQMSADELRKAGRSGIVDKSDPRIARFLEQRAQAGHYRGELDFRRKDGTVFPGEISSAVFTGIGGVARTAMIIRDITERKRAEEALRESEEKYRNIVETATEAIVIVDAQARIVFVNDRWSEMFGYSREETMHMTHFEVVFPEDMAQMKERWESRKRGRKESYELCLRRKDGNPVWVLVGVAPNFGPEGEFLGTLVMLADITDRKRAEQAMVAAKTAAEAAAEAKSRFLAFVDSTSDGVVILSAVRDPGGAIVDFRYEYINEAGALLNERPVAEHLGKTVLELLPAHEGTELWDEYIRVTEQGGTVAKESLLYEDVYGGGQRLQRAFDIRASKLDDGLAVLWRDVTPRYRAEEELRESEEKFRLLAETSPAAILIYQDGKYVYVNPAAESITGYTRAELLAQAPGDIVEPDYHEQVRQILSRREQRQEPPMHYELEILTKDGQRRWMDCRTVSIRYENKPAGLVVAFDITERKKAEETLGQEKESYRTLAENLPGLVYRIHFGDGRRMEFFNRSLIDMTGYTQAELTMGEVCSIDPLILAEDRDAVVEAVRQAIADHQPFVIEYRLRTKAGEVRHFAERGLPVYAPDGACTHLDGVIFDVTQRREAEEAMRREAQILAQVHDCVVTTDLQGNITLWNRGAERVFGYSADEALGQHISLVYFDEDLPILSNRIIAPMLERSENELEVRCRHKSGREVFLHLSLSVLRDENDSPIELIGYSLDITERKKAEEALRRSQQRLKLAQYSAGAGMWDWDISTGKLEWSEELFALLGLDPAKDEASFETWMKAVHPDDRLVVQKQIEEAVENRTPLNSESRIVLESGQVRWINALGDTVYDDDGKPQRMSGICLDITDRKLAEEQIRNIARFPDENPFPVLRLSADGTIQYSNVPGQVLLDEWNCQTSQKAPEYWCNLVKKALRYNRNQVEQAKCGDRIYSFTITPVHDGKYVNLYGRDITIQEQVKGFLRKSRDLLEERVRERTAELVKTVALLEGEIEQRKHTEKLLRLEEARLEALVNLSNIHEGSVNEICHFILEQGIALTNSKIGFIGFLSEDESVYTIHAVSKAIVGECDVVGNPTHWPVSDAGIWADVIKQRKTLFVNDYRKAHPGKKGLPAGHVPLDRFMIVPLFEGKRIVVVAGLGNKASIYDSSDERQMTLLLAGMWNYVQRKRATEAIQQRTAELSRVNAELEKEVAERRRAEHSLWERSRDLDAFFSHTITPLVILDRKFNFVRVNRAYAEAGQRDISEFAGHNHFEFYPHKENERIFKKVVRTKKPYHALAKPFSYADHPEWGVTYWDWTLVPVLDEAGKVQLLILSLKDVTESKRTEIRKGVVNSLLELFAQKTSRKEYLDSVVQIIRDWSGCECVGIRITNDDGRIPYESSVGFSKKFLSLENNLCLHTDACVCIRVITQVLEAQDSRAMTARGSFRCDNVSSFVDLLSEGQKKRYRSNCPDAGFASIVVVPVRYRQKILGAIHLADKSQNKAPLETVEFLEDMALLVGEAVRRFDVEQSLRLNEERLLEAQRIAHLGNWRWEIATNKLWWSDEVYRIVGVKPKDFKATYEGFLSFVHPNDREFVKQSVNRAVYDHQPYNIDHRIILSDGAERVVHEQAEVIYDAEQNPVRMLGTMQDVTEQKRAEAELLEQRRQLRSLTAEMLISEERERRQIAADLHDSVGQILAFSARELVALQKSASSETVESLREVWGQLEKAIQLTRTLTFDLSPSVLYDLGFEVAIEDLIEQFSKKQNIRYGFESCREFKPLTYPMKILLYRSVRELLINISKHAKAKTVRISLTKLNNDICITVEDDGIGIDPSLLKSGVQKPKGFGLFSIRERLAHIGGQFRIESVKGRGTRVTMLAPLNLQKKGFE